MQRNVAPVPCPVCGALDRFVIAATGKFELIYVNCPGGDPLYWPRLANSELRPPQ